MQSRQGFILKFPKAENLELVAALIVAAGLVAGNMYFFFPFREDTRFKGSSGVNGFTESSAR